MLATNVRLPIITAKSGPRADWERRLHNLTTRLLDVPMSNLELTSTVIAIAEVREEGRAKGWWIE